MKKKTFDYLIALSIIICLNFLLPRLLPGDPVAVIFGDEALISMTEDLKAELIKGFGLDKSLPEQFIVYLGSLCKGNLGYSYYYQDSVMRVILASLPWTILLVGLSLIISTVFGFIMGLNSGWNYGNFKDKGMFTLLMLLNGFPDFFIGMVLLMVFAVKFSLFPFAGAFTHYQGLTGIYLLKDVIWHLILPLTSLVLAEIASCYLLSRTTVVTVLGESFILTARAKGIKENGIKYQHVGRNCFLPILTSTGIRVGRMITGALLIENVFAYPGIGSLIYKSLLTRDYPMTQGIFFIVAVGVLGVNYLLEIIYRKVDPRVV